MVNYRSSFDDYLAAVQLAARSQYTFLQRYWCLPLYIGIGFLAAWAASSFYRSYIQIDGPSGRAVGLAIFVVLAVAGISLVQRFVTRPVAARWFTNNYPDHEVHVELLENALFLEQGSSTGMVSFDDIRDIAIDEKVILLFYASGFVYVPRRAFSGQPAAEDFVRTAFSKIGEEAQDRARRRPNVQALIS